VDRRAGFYWGTNTVRTSTRFLLAVLVCCVGCEPRDVPCFSPDGKEIAFLVEPVRGNAERRPDVLKVGIVTLADGKIRTFTLPDKWSADGLVWVGPRLIVEASRPLDVIKVEGQTREGLYFLLDQATGKFAEAPFKPHMLYSPFAGRFNGKPRIYAQDMTPEVEDQKTRAYRPDDLALMGELPFAAQGAGRGWFVRVVREAQRPETRGLLPPQMTGVEVFGPDGRKVCTLLPEEIAKACWRDARAPLCARVFENGSKIFLGFDTGTIFRRCPTEYTFGVFDTKTGAMLWTRGSNGLMGLPVATSDAVYILEAKERKVYTGERTPAALLEPPPETSGPTSELVLARHSEKGRSVVLDIRLEDGESASRYSVSPDGKTMVVLVEGPEPRLLLVPIKEAVTAAELRSVPLDVR